MPLVLSIKLVSYIEQRISKLHHKNNFRKSRQITRRKNGRWGQPPKWKVSPYGRLLRDKKKPQQIIHFFRITIFFFNCAFNTCKSYICNRHEQTKGYTYLPNFSINRSVLRQDDFVNKSGYQQQEHVNCKYLNGVFFSFSLFFIRSPIQKFRRFTCERESSIERTISCCHILFIYLYLYESSRRLLNSISKDSMWCFMMLMLNKQTKNSVLHYFHWPNVIGWC